MSVEVIKFRNPTQHTIKLAAVGLPDVAPGETVDVPLAVCAATIRDNGRRGKSTIEKCAPQLVPADDAERAEWEKTPTPLPRASLMVTTSQRVPGEPAGVVALRDAKAKARTAVAAAETVPTVPTVPTTPPTGGPFIDPKPRGVPSVTDTGKKA